MLAILILILIFLFVSSQCLVPDPEKHVPFYSKDVCGGFGNFAYHGWMALSLGPFFLLAYVTEPVTHLIFFWIHPELLLYISIIVTLVLLVIVYYFIIKFILSLITNLFKKGWIQNFFRKR